MSVDDILEKVIRSQVGFQILNVTCNICGYSHGCLEVFRLDGPKSTGYEQTYSAFVHCLNEDCENYRLVYHVKNQASAIKAAVEAIKQYNTNWLEPMPAKVSKEIK